MLLTRLHRCLSACGLFIHKRVYDGIDEGGGILGAIIKFEVDEEILHLAQQLLESQNRTLDDACRELVEQLAEQQARLAHDAWVTKQVDKAFEKIDSGRAVFIEHSAAMAMFEERKTKIRQG